MGEIFRKEKWGNEEREVGKGEKFINVFFNGLVSNMDGYGV